MKLSALIRFFLYTLFSHAAIAGDCEHINRKAPPQLKAFVDKYIGKENFLNYSLDFSSLGLTSRDCPTALDQVCKPSSASKTKYYSYPIVDGLYNIDLLPTKMEMSVGEVLDAKYSLTDAKNIVKQRIGIASNRAYEISYNSLSRYFNLSESYVLYGKHFSIDVEIVGMKESPGVHNVTAIKYTIIDGDDFFRYCHAKHSTKSANNQRSEIKAPPPENANELCKQAVSMAGGDSGYAYGFCGVSTRQAGYWRCIISSLKESGKRGHSNNEIQSVLGYAYGSSCLGME